MESESDHTEKRNQLADIIHKVVNAVCSKSESVNVNGDIVNIKPPCSFKGISIHELENHIEKEHPELLINFNIHKKKNYLNLI